MNFRYGEIPFLISVPGHTKKKERPPKFRIPEKDKELLDFYAPFKGGFLFLTLW